MCPITGELNALELTLLELSITDSLWPAKSIGMAKGQGAREYSLKVIANREVQKPSDSILIQPG